MPPNDNTINFSFLGGKKMTKTSKEITTSLFLFHSFPYEHKKSKMQSHRVAKDIHYKPPDKCNLTILLFLP